MHCPDRKMQFFRSAFQRFTIEVAHGEGGVAHADAHGASIKHQRELQVGGNFEIRFALIQAGAALGIDHLAGKRRVGVKQHF